MTKRKKPLRRYGRRYWPGAKIARMMYGDKYFELHPRKGIRPTRARRWE